jgi:hypothetical protein
MLINPEDIQFMPEQAQSSDLVCLPPMDIDKSKFPEGPWTTEPDTASWVDREFPCAIRRNFAGALCGYIGVPVDHPFFSAPAHQTLQEYVEHTIEVHGDVTLFKKIGDFYWIGFDCCHLGDFAPNVGDIASGEAYRDFAYVQGQVKSMVDQVSSYHQISILPD